MGDGEQTRRGLGLIMRARRSIVVTVSIAALVLPVPPAAGQDPGFMEVQPNAGQVSGNAWEAGSSLTVTLHDDGGTLKASQSVTVDAEGYFSLSFESAGIAAGDEVRVSGSGVSLTHVVAELEVTAQDYEADVLRGIGPPSSEVTVGLWRPDDDGQTESEAYRTVATSSSGRWTADFGGSYDFNQLDVVQLTWDDGGGASTGVYDQSAMPSIDASLDDDAVWGGNWTPGSTLTITVDDDEDPGNGVLLRLDDTVVAPDAGFHEDLDLDLVPDLHVIVDDGDVSKHVRLPRLTASADRAGDVVTGTSDARGEITVYVTEGGANEPAAQRWVMPGEDGTWRAEFGSGEDAHDLTAASRIEISQWDGNSDRVNRRIEPLVETEGPVSVGFGVAVRADRVRGQRWRPSTTIHIIVDDNDDPGDGTLQEVATTTLDDGSFESDLQFDVRAGHVVTVTDGATTRDHVVRNLVVSEVDRDRDRALGAADAQSYVQLDAHDQETGEGAGRLVRADDSGSWVADFVGRLDLTTATDVTATQYDDDGDWTSVTIPAPNPVLSGSNREETAAAVSQATYGEGEAEAVVLARRDDFADALAGTPFAVAMHAPLLLTGRDALPGATADEMQRVLLPGRTVYVLGGTAVIGQGVVDEVRQRGYGVERISGPSRFETAVAIASRVPDPKAVLLTTAWNFPDGLAAGAAAPQVEGVVLLTEGDEAHAATTAWLARHPGITTYAIGGPASRAHPGTRAIKGSSREGTALAVAAEFFTAPRVVGISRYDDFPDALAGGVHVGWAGGPMLLTPPTALHPDVESYLEANRETIDTAFAYGGSSALSRDVLSAILAAID